jgi:hypothetical protein
LYARSGHISSTTARISSERLSMCSISSMYFGGALGPPASSPCRLTKRGL